MPFGALPQLTVTSIHRGPVHDYCSSGVIVFADTLQKPFAKTNSIGPYSKLTGFANSYLNFTVHFILTFLITLRCPVKSSHSSTTPTIIAIPNSKLASLSLSAAMTKKVISNNYPFDSTTAILCHRFSFWSPPPTAYPT